MVENNANNELLKILCLTAKQKGFLQPIIHRPQYHARPHNTDLEPLQDHTELKWNCWNWGTWGGILSIQVLDFSQTSCHYYYLLNHFPPCPEKRHSVSLLNNWLQIRFTVHDCLVSNNSWKNVAKKLRFASLKYTKKNYRNFGIVSQYFCYSRAAKIRKIPFCTFDQNTTATFNNNNLQ